MQQSFSANAAGELDFVPDHYFISYDTIQQYLGLGSRNIRHTNSCWGIASQAILSRNTLSDRKLLSEIASVFEKEKYVRKTLLI